MATYNKFHPFVEYLAEGKMNLETDTLKVMLTNTAPSSSFGLKAELTEIGAGNGYTAGGTQTAQAASAHSTGIYKLIVADVVWTASGGTIGALRYTALYDDTPSTPLDPLIGYHDYGSSITLQATETFTWDTDTSSGILQIA